MKYHQIEAFYQVMLTGSFSKAAQNLGRTQPAVSMTIATLEDQLATTLFDRHAGRITPRAEADVLFQQVSPVMTQLNDIRHRFGRLSSIEVPRISIISSGNAGTHLVPSAISNIAAGGQQLRLMIGTSASILSEMENQLHDIALTDEGTSAVLTNSSLFEVETFKIPVVAVFQRGLLPSVGNQLLTDDLAGHDVCTLYEENRSSREIRSKIVAPKVEFSNFFPMACYAISNRSVAIVDNITLGTLKALTTGCLDVEYRLVTDASPSLYYLIRPKYRQRSKVADRCYERLKSALLTHQQLLTPHASIARLAANKIC